MNVHFSSNKEDWETPHRFFQELNDEFHFDLDVCANKHNAKCKNYFTKEDNALEKSWHGNCWMNPPYGRKISNWIHKANYEATCNPKVNLVVCLIPARTDTGWWHDYVMYKGDIRFIRGRLKFSGSKWNAPFPSAIVIFRKETKRIQV
jgi:phage N-6-adenine-methyltransferase